MDKERPVSPTELEPLAAGLAETFIQRWDLYPRQLDDGTYACVHEPLTPGHILAHLRGEITLGAYLLDEGSRARFMALDADDPDQMDGLFAIARSLRADEIPSYLERSRRGGHLWLFFQEAVSGKDARAFGRGLMTAHNLEGIELYPKQDQLKDGPGSLIRLPFGVHRWDMSRYGFITPYGQPLAPRLREQIPLFYAPQRVPEAAFGEFWEIDQLHSPIPEFAPTEGARDALSQSIKAAISVQEFVGRYVELTPSGRGHCPFHDDEHKSFSVNAEKNYWHCFAGCGGGSVIDFWMRWKGCDFTSAIHELREIVLEG